MRTLEMFPTVRVRDGMMAILARHTLETEGWLEFDHGIFTDSDRDHSALQLAAGLSGAYTDKMAVAEAALTNIRNVRRSWLGSESTAQRAAWRMSVAAVAEKELEAAMARARGEDSVAEALLVGATVLEGGLNAPQGPPFPIKSAHEMYGEFLLARVRAEEAAVQFAKALERMPNRTLSVRGLESALAAK